MNSAFVSGVEQKRLANRMEKNIMDGTKVFSLYKGNISWRRMVGRQREGFQDVSVGNAKCGKPSEHLGV